MKALSIRQPWSHAILHLGKDIENRDWRHKPSYTGPLLLHAGKAKPHRDDTARVRELVTDWAVWKDQPHALPTGGYVGLVLLGQAHYADDCGCSRWAEPGVWHLPVSDPRPFAAVVPAHGQLGFWRPALTDELTAALRSIA